MKAKKIINDYHKEEYIHLRNWLLRYYPKVVDEYEDDEENKSNLIYT